MSFEHALWTKVVTKSWVVNMSCKQELGTKVVNKSWEQNLWMKVVNKICELDCEQKLGKGEQNLCTKTVMKSF